MFGPCFYVGEVGNFKFFGGCQVKGRFFHREYFGEKYIGGYEHGDWAGDGVAFINSLMPRADLGFMAAVAKRRAL